MYYNNTGNTVFTKWYTDVILFYNSCAIRRIGIFVLSRDNGARQVGRA